MRVNAKYPNMKPISLRLEVLRFAWRMEKKLRANDYKGGWQEDTLDALFGRLRDDEVAELDMALNSPTPRIKEDLEDIINEATDVANFAMMMADNADVELEALKQPQ